MELDRARISFRFPDQQRDETRQWMRSDVAAADRTGAEQDGWAFHLNLRTETGRLLGRLEVEKYDLIIPEVTRFIERLRNAVEMRIPHCLEYHAAEDAS
ncbi:MAG TPA: hypothetical protein PKK36_07640 [Kiritimatiellia bacterium]|nr:hypothetical protein [Kiritimatiellia bacterium]